MNMYDAYAVVTNSSLCARTAGKAKKKEKHQQSRQDRDFITRDNLVTGTSLSAARTSLSGVPHGYGGRL